MSKPPRYGLPQRGGFVGYQTTSVKAGSTTAFGVQFEDVANSEAGVPVKKIVTVGTPAGATGANSTADQIWTYDGHEWTKYYFYKRGTTTKWCLAGSTTEIGDNVVLKAGQSFYFIRSDVSDSDLTFSGGVVPLSANRSYDVKAGSTTAMAYPWPQAMKIKDFQKYNSAPAGATGANSTADQIWTYDGHDWTKYYFYKRGTTTKWCVAGTTTEIGDDIVIQSAAGFFFIRSDTADATITFAR